MKFYRSVLSLSVGLLMVNGFTYAEIIDHSQIKTVINSSEEPKSEESTILFSSVIFEGNLIYKTQDLEKIVADKIGLPLTLEDIKTLAKKIEEKYHQDGYVITKVIVPEQEFSNTNPVEFLILEGKLGKINVIGNGRYKGEFITQSLSASEIVSGKAFKVDSLENTLARLNKQSGIQVASVLRSGEEQGYTDIDVKVVEEDRISAVLDLNNYGSKNTGEYRAVGQVNASNLTGRGDSGSLLGLHTIDGEGSYYFNLAYNTPVNAYGTKVGAYYALGNVNVGEELAILDIKGENKSWGLGLQQDHILDLNNLLQYEAWLESYEVNQEVLGMTTTEDKIRKLKLGVNYEHLNASSRSFYSLNLHQGLGEKFGAMPNDFVLSTRAIANADNSFTKISFDWMRLQRVNARTLFIPRIYGQYAFDSVVSGEQIAIGGISSVVGNPNALYSGDSGYNINVEGRYAIFPSTEKYQLTAKLDYGQVFVKKSFLAESKDENLAGVGIGFIATPHKNFSLKFDYGHGLTSTNEKNEYAYIQAKFNY